MSGSNTKLLILDDARSICSLIQSVAEEMGIEVISINDSDAFESTYLEFGPNLIMLDLQMPGMNGEEILGVLSNHQSNSAIVIISGLKEDDIDTAVQSGESKGLNMAGALPKPIDIEDLKKTLTNLSN